MERFTGLCRSKKRVRRKSDIRSGRKIRKTENKKKKEKEKKKGRRVSVSFVKNETNKNKNKKLVSPREITQVCSILLNYRKRIYVTAAYMEQLVCLQRVGSLWL